MEAADLQPAEARVMEAAGRVKSLEEELKTTQDELTTAKKQLAKSQRQLETAEMYNEDLRQQVDMLNQELHRYKRRQVEDRACQTEDMLAPWAVEASQQLPNSEGNTEASINEVDTTGMSLADSLRATAEAALSQTGTVYDESSGLYYDYTTGMYYDPNNHLHYDPTTGVYYYYDEQTQSYQFHSQVELPASFGEDATEQGEEDRQKKQKDKEKKKRKKRHKDDSEACQLEASLIDKDKEVKKHLERKRHRKKKKRRAKQEEVEVIDISSEDGTEEGGAKQENLRTYQNQPPLEDKLRTNQPPLEDKLSTNQNQPALEDGMGMGADVEEGEVPGADLEEGEVVDSAEEDDVVDSAEEDDVDEEEMEEDQQSEESDCSGESEESDESSLQWPPCIRVMVQESDTLRPGSLFIVTCDGGTIGREKDRGHAVRIPDLNVSKSHVEIRYDRGAGQYTISDLGSQNGTLLNGQRISEPKCKSAPWPVAHQAELQLGGTVLSLHIHSGTETCDGCEPGQVMAAIAAREKQQQQAEEAAPVLSKEDKERQRRRELKQIKKKYQLENAPFVVSKNSVLQTPGYKDRAGERRHAVGSDNPYQKDDAPSSVHQAIGTSNKGRKMLEKMGWKEGKGLGKTSQGRQEPVQVSLRESQAGLGASVPRDMESVQLKTGKGKNWRKARERFYAMEQTKQLSVPSRPINQNRSWVQGETVGNVCESSLADTEQVTQDTPQQGPLDKDVKIFDD